MSEHLVAVVNGRKMGELHYDRKPDQLTFLYDEVWRTSKGYYPLSLSMPLAAREHGDAKVRPFVWNLLPDNEGVLRQWRRQFQISNHPYRFLEHVGEECAGAVQFVRPDREVDFLGPKRKASLTWLTEDQLAERIVDLTNNPANSRRAGEEGHFSLAGAQPKTAFHFDEVSGRWAIPGGAAPTTHIFKPSTGEFDGIAENELFCLRLAANLGLLTAEAEVHHFTDIPTIVVRRFDRPRNQPKIRIHQEDICQALGRHPREKYQNEGGPTPKEIFKLIQNEGTSPLRDQDRFLDALIFNWLVGGTDAHGKNYGFLLSGLIVLAPIYDVASCLPYPKEIQRRNAKLAMKMGSHYHLDKIRLEDWEKAGTSWGVGKRRVRERIMAMIDKMPHAIDQTRSKLEDEGINHPIVARLNAELPDWLQHCKQA